MSINVCLLYSSYIGRLSRKFLSPPMHEIMSRRCKFSCFFDLIILSAKPADKKHPFGHARFEYIASMVIAIAMLMVASPGRTSIERIISNHLTTDTWTLVVLVAPILLKILQYYIYKSGDKIQSPILLASSKDSTRRFHHERCCRIRHPLCCVRYQS